MTTVRSANTVSLAVSSRQPSVCDSAGRRAVSGLGRFTGPTRPSCPMTRRKVRGRSGSRPLRGFSGAPRRGRGRVMRTVLLVRHLALCYMNGVGRTSRGGRDQPAFPAPPSRILCGADEMELPAKIQQSGKGACGSLPGGEGLGAGVVPSIFPQG